MSKLKCGKVKNPCKICLQPVTQKNGLQCQGICSSWVHFNCINYTPGRIKDIKTGVLKINCPCPDCDTDEGKEYYINNVNERALCADMSCPARMPPSCTNIDCVENIKSGINTGTGTNYSEPNVRHSGSVPNRRHSMNDIDNDSMRGPGDGSSSRNQNLNSDINQVIITMGELSKQINTLVSKLQSSMESQSMDGSNQQLGSQNVCPKPKTYTQHVSQNSCPNPCFCKEGKKGKQNK